MSHVTQEIASQPDCWRRAIALVPEVGRLLPAPGQRSAVLGCGTSWFIAQAYARLREAAGHGETDAFTASEFPAERGYDAVVAITRSGTTTEVLDAVRGHAATVILADPQTPAGDLAAGVIALPWADERSVVQTRFATTTLALLSAHVGAPPDMAAAEKAVVAPLPLDPSAVEQVSFLGSGWTVGLAHEAALKCREAAGLWTESYPAMEYRHGPVAIAAPRRAVWMFGDPPAGLAEQIGRTGATFVNTGRDPFADLVLAQRFAVEAAAHHGLDPDAPRNLTRSVVLR
ncbi:SIS domain-containing protein [Plantactinospora solaniradicis]|uniref:SIS domain-containing protein n=1 Tax=Plantactinospora solaniradicis TaxID=1723736 RepID=A0ABW1KJ37_9ACTN